MTGEYVFDFAVVVLGVRVWFILCVPLVCITGGCLGLHACAHVLTTAFQLF
jgi:hypothetical protein